MWAFDWYQNRWSWMTLNDVMAVILRHFTKFVSLRDALSKRGWRYRHKKVHVRYLISWWVSCSILFPCNDMTSLQFIVPPFTAGNKLTSVDSVIIYPWIRCTSTENEVFILSRIKRKSAVSQYSLRHVQATTTQEVTATSWLLQWCHRDLRQSFFSQRVLHQHHYPTVYGKYSEYIQESPGSRVGQQKFALNSSPHIYKYK